MLPLVIILSSLTLAPDPITLETDSFRYVLASNATSMAFVDKANNTDYCDTQSATPFAVWIDDASHPATQARRDSDNLILQFGDATREATFRVTAHKRRLEFELVSLNGNKDSLRTLHFGSIPLTLKGTSDEPFAVSPLALTVETQCAEIPGFNSTISGAVSFKELGFEGTAFAVIACPADELRDALKDAVTDADALPKSPTGGPWALEADINRQSYFIDVSAKVTEKTVASWITMLNDLGVKQLDLHGGHAFRFGDCMPNPELYPKGRESLKAVIDTLHDAGIAVGLHTYAMFIAKDTPWVTPIPDSGLAKAGLFTLANDIGPGDAVIPVLETTENMSASTGFLVANSATIQIDEELIVFSGISKNPPYAFTECMRGAHGTAASSHGKNAKVHHLKECFGLFAPDPDSELFHKVISETAKTYNECGFDMMYLDALDGSHVIDAKRNGELGWHYGAKFTYELMRQLKKPPLLEMSTFSHHLWVVRSRMGAWDACQRAPQTFADMHVLSNREWRDHFLPTNVGWWAVFPWSGVQPNRSLPDDVEYICAKALGTDSSLSLLLGFSPDTYGSSHNQQRLGAIIKRYETLRLTNAVPKSVRDQIAQPGQAFRLDNGPNGEPLFRPVDFHRHDITSADGNVSWQVDNRYDAQTPRITIENSLSLESYDSPKSALIEDFSNPSLYSEVKCNTGVSATFSVVDAPVKDAPRSAAIIATNASAEPRRAWVNVERKFVPPINMNSRGMGMWVHADGKGALLSVQLRSPKHVTPAITQYYVKLDFVGWRYVELVNTADYAIEQYEWPYSRPRSDWQNNVANVTSFAYPVYHAHMDYAQIGELHLSLNDLPQGEEVKVFLGPIRSLRHKNATIQNPTIAFNGQRITFPVSMETGHMLEFTPPDDYAVYDKDGELLIEGISDGEVAVLKAGGNSAEFACELPEATSVHARVTVATVGDIIKN